MFVARRYKQLLEAARRDRNEGRFWEDIDGEIKAHSGDEFRIRDIWESFVDGGREILDIWARDRGDLSMITLQEAGVTTLAFARITEKIFGKTVLDAWNDPQFIADQLVRTINTEEIDGEKMGGLSKIGDMIESIGEGMPYPMGGISDEYVETPRTDKYGLLVPVTKEALIKDKTGQLLDRCQTHALALRINKEKRVLDTVCGITTSYRRNGGAAQATYGTTHTEGTFNNQLVNPIADEASIQTSDLAFDAITDPNTGDPITVMPTTVLCAKDKYNRAFIVFNATEYREVSGSKTLIYNNPLDMNRINGLRNRENVLTNSYVASRVGNTTTWFRGDFKKAFAYMQVWGITTARAPRNSELEFTNDIVERFKVSERGVPAVMEPRYVQKNTAS